MRLLENILEAKRKEIDARKREKPLSELKRILERERKSRDFKGSLRGRGIRLIGEIKKSSPREGVLRDPFDPLALAVTYEESGAAALSVLTDEPFFGGHLSFLRRIKPAVTLPLLRKDFILEEYQIYESADAEADAVLFIVSLLTEKDLAAFIRGAARLGMASLVEVHTDAELTKALNAEAEIIGINNRNLRTFEVDFRTSERLITRIPKGKIAVSESGIHSHEEVVRLEGLGFHAVLIGQAFMERPDLEKAIHEVMGQ